MDTFTNSRRSGQSNRTFSETPFSSKQGHYKHNGVKLPPIEAGSQLGSVKNSQVFNEGVSRMSGDLGHDESASRFMDDDPMLDNSRLISKVTEEEEQIETVGDDVKALNNVSVNDKKVVGKAKVAAVKKPAAAPAPKRVGRK